MDGGGKKYGKFFKKLKNSARRAEFFIAKGKMKELLGGRFFR